MSRAIDPEWADPHHFDVFIIGSSSEDARTSSFLYDNKAEAEEQAELQGGLRVFSVTAVMNWGTLEELSNDD